jgi:long-subunit acyl-CoA synthetase (AMP-forming)
MNTEIGNYLSDSGVQLYTIYGMTEVGILGCMFPRSLGGHEWEYLTMNPHCAVHFVPTGDGAYELFVLSTPTQAMTVQLDAEFDGVKALATQDLLVPHPTKKGYWKLLGRSVDQILLSSGVKVTAKPLEDALNNSPKVLSCVTFGQGREHIGILIQLAETEEQAHLSEIEAELWDIASKKNELLPEEGRLKKEMILFTKPEKPFFFTSKVRPYRRKILQSYEDEINELYDTYKRYDMSV